MSEAVYAALRERMNLVSWTRADNSEHVFKTKTRRIVMFDQVAPDQQAWCGQAEYGEQYDQTSGLPYKTVLEAHWLIYQCIAKDPKAEASIENNLIVEGCRAALAARPSDVGFYERRNTLGNLVYKCYINGRIFKDPGDIDGQGLILIPIRILVP